MFLSRATDSIAFEMSTPTIRFTDWESNSPTRPVPQPASRTSADAVIWGAQASATNVAPRYGLSPVIIASHLDARKLYNGCKRESGARSGMGASPILERNMLAPT